MTDKIVVLVTCSTATEADRIAWALVEGQLAACVNVLEAPVRSTYRWQGKVESASEYLLVIKTARHLFAALRDEVLRLHTYDTPEIIALPVAEGSQKYLAWIAESVRSTERPARAKTKKRV